VAHPFGAANSSPSHRDLSPLPQTQGRMAAEPGELGAAAAPRCAKPGQRALRPPLQTRCVSEPSGLALPRHLDQTPGDRIDEGRADRPSRPHSPPAEPGLPLQDLTPGGCDAGHPVDSAFMAVASNVGSVSARRCRSWPGGETWPSANQALVAWLPDSGPRLLKPRARSSPLSAADRILSGRTGLLDVSANEIRKTLAPSKACPRSKRGPVHKPQLSRSPGSVSLAALLLMTRRWCGRAVRVTVTDVRGCAGPPHPRPAQPSQAFPDSVGFARTSHAAINDALSHSVSHSFGSLWRGAAGRRAGGFGSPASHSASPPVRPSASSSGARAAGDQWR